MDGLHGCGDQLLLLMWIIGKEAGVAKNESSLINNAQNDKVPAELKEDEVEPALMKLKEDEVEPALMTLHRLVWGLGPSVTVWYESVLGPLLERLVEVAYFSNSRGFGFARFNTRAYLEEALVLPELDCYKVIR
ncbi:hypothetical protein Tco_0524651 [Tanacetum coccineum]